MFDGAESGRTAKGADGTSTILRTVSGACYFPCGGHSENSESACHILIVIGLDYVMSKENCCRTAPAARPWMTPARIGTVCREWAQLISAQEYAKPAPTAGMAHQRRAAASPKKIFGGS
jgi:hypothetical protein